MKYNEYYSSSMLGRIGITFRGEEKEPEPDDEELIMMYVDVYTLGLGVFLDIVNKYRTKNLSSMYPAGLIGPIGLTFDTLGHYEFSEETFWETASTLGIGRRPPAGGYYDVGTYPNDVPFNDVQSIIAINPEVTGLMNLLKLYGDRANDVDLYNSCHGLLGTGGRISNIFGLTNQSLYSITNGYGGAWLVPRFNFFTVPTNVPYDVGVTVMYNLPAGHSASSSVRAKCINGTITFDSPQPWVNTSINFPFDLSPINVGSSVSSTLYMWFSVRCLRGLGFICTKKEAEKWIEDTNKWIKSVGLDKGMIQLHLDPHIEDIPDWYKAKLGI